MTSISIFLAIVAFGQSEPRPIDGFRANAASVAARADFSYRRHFGGSPLHDGSSVSYTPNLLIADAALYHADGIWEADGDKQHLSIRVRHINDSGKRAISVALPGEQLWDNEITMYRIATSEVEPWRIRATVPTSIPPFTLIGPMFWFQASLSDGLIQDEFDGVTPEVRVSNRGGYLTETEIYHKPLEGGWYQAEVSYDPSIGHIPRHVRILLKDATGKAHIKEAFVLSARPCNAGGFVPTEWCELFYSLSRFQEKYPSYTHETLIVPPKRVSVGHMTVNTLVDSLAEPATTPQLKVRDILTPNKIMNTSTFNGPITLASIKSALGNTPLTPALRPLNLDVEEQTRYTKPAPSWSLGQLAVGLACVSGIIIIMFVRKYKAHAGDLVKGS